MKLIETQEVHVIATLQLNSWKKKHGYGYLHVNILKISQHMEGATLERSSE